MLRGMVDPPQQKVDSEESCGVVEAATGHVGVSPTPTVLSEVDAVAGSSGPGRGIHESQVDMEEPELPGTDEVVSEIDPEVHIFPFFLVEYLRF